MTYEEIWLPSKDPWFLIGQGLPVMTIYVLADKTFQYSLFCGRIQLPSNEHDFWENKALLMTHAERTEVTIMKLTYQK